MVKLGEFELTALSDGCFRLDGGSMFGVVPRPLWEKHKPPDELNRIHLGLNCLMVRAPGELVLVEAGLGGKLTGRDAGLYGLDRSAGLPEDLAAHGFRAEEVDCVVLTHLHLDHCGWATREEAGRLVPTFPRARYVVQSREWEAARRPDPRSRPSYDRRNFEALESTGCLVLMDGDGEVSPGVSVRLTGGHTSGHQVVTVESGGERCVFLGDMVPTFAHLRVHWHMSWDLYPLELMEAKEALLSEAALRGYLLFFTHEDTVPFARLEGEGEPRLVPLAP
jgi:glyoxylase-like metal-dependent hydrolase (beta-lactamase superfamily II)